ncbi:hypothetical protein [Lentilitoribacter sp. EG35]|uniref:hypothetical protein n=1 Tax=Lentilitoribacter sp. EG35 TaxID=3234192 RepID=UPI0034611122
MKISKIISTSAALVFAATVSITTSSIANADTSRIKAKTVMNAKIAKKRAPVPAGFANMKASNNNTAAIRDNVAHAWTAGCYAEFGPNAKWPDDALLQKCLDT